MAAAAHRIMTLNSASSSMIQNNCVLVSAANMLASKSASPMYGKRPIAPAPLTSSNGANQVVAALPKKAYKYGMQYPVTQTASVARRNARERNRVKQVNNGFSNLRQHIPQSVVTSLTKGGRGASKKLSKVDTLKLAVEYIRGLKDLLEDNENSSSAGSSSSFYSTSEKMIPRSEASISPTPSYSSDASSTMSYTPNHHQAHHQMSFKQEPFDSYAEQSTSPAPSSYHSDAHHSHHHSHHHPHLHQMYPSSTSTPFKPAHHTYESYSPVSADDEELLDAIAWWQQQ